MKKFKDFVKEDGEGGVPANNAGSGNIAGLGVGPKGEPGVDLRKRDKARGKERLAKLNARINEATDAEIEAAAKAVHDQWVEKQKELGHDSHKSPDGKEDYMVPFHKLSDNAKDLDRGAVKAVLDVVGESAERETFAGAPVFEVDMDRVMKSRFGKNRYHRYSRYVGEDETGEAIRQHGRTRKSGDIVLKDSATAVMTYLRRKAPK